MNRTFFILPAVAMLAACGGTTRPEGFSAALPPAPVPQAARPADGAIYQVSQGYAPLYYGNRAARVGDLLTVVLVESTQTGKTTSGSTQRNGSASITPPTAGPLSIDPNALNLSASGSFKGSGNASQTSFLNADLSVTIAEVRPNGTALVRGEKLMNFSQGEEWVQLSGIVRLADIDQDNRIFSNRIADARISYTGSGSLQRAGREGWLSRFFSAVSPF